MEKIKKYAKLAATVATVAMAIYTLIPKSEKIKGIDTSPLEERKAKVKESETEITA